VFCSGVFGRIRANMLLPRVTSVFCSGVFGRIRANMLLPRVTSVFCSGAFGRIRDSSTSREYASTVTTAERFWAFISAHPQISTLQNHVQQNSQFRPHPTLANNFCRTSPHNEVKEKYIKHGPSSGSPQRP